MKLVVLISLLAVTEAVSSSAIRRRNRVGFEFGRAAAASDQGEVDEAFREMKFATMRMLGDISSTRVESGMSMPDYGMSMPFEGGMSMPFEGGMSMSYSESPPTSGDSSPPEGPVPCVPANTTSSPFGIFPFSLDVEVLNDDSGFVDDLTQGFLNAVASKFSICLDLGSLMRRKLEDTGIVGVEVHEDASVLTNESCLAATPGAGCHVVYSVLKFYTNGEVSESEAAQLIYLVLQESVSGEDSLKEVSGNDNIVAIRIRSGDGNEGEGPQNTEATVTSTENNSSASRNSDSTSRGGFTGAIRTATFTVLGLFCVSAVASVVYKKSTGRDPPATNDDDLNSSCSTIPGATGDHAAQQSVLAVDLA